jgi:hypothetical protein
MRAQPSRPDDNIGLKAVIRKIAGRERFAPTMLNDSARSPGGTGLGGSGGLGYIIPVGDAGVVQW